MKTLQTLRYTNAPATLDRTDTTDHGVVGRTRHGKPVRLVGIDPDYLYLQETTYHRRGMYFSLSKDLWEDTCTRGLAAWIER